MPEKRGGVRLEKQLKIYSAAAAGALALAPTAEAAIHYSGVQNIAVDKNNNTPYDIDFDGNGPQFRIAFVTSTTQSRTRNYMGLKELTSNAAHIRDSGGAYHSDPLNLSGNYLIGPTPVKPHAYWNNSAPSFDTLNGAHSYGTGWKSSSSGNFNNTPPGYIGVRFETQCGLAYGWIHYSGVTSIGEGVDISGTIIDWAYEDSCQPIAAGQTLSTTVPTLNEWGMIIFMLLAGGLAAKKLKKLGKEEN